LSLYLYEQIMLLALRDKEGTINPVSHYQFALAGAILADLLLHKFVHIDRSKRRKIVELDNFQICGDNIIDECLSKLKNANRRASIETWIHRFSSLRDLKHRVARQLCAKGILRADEDTILLIFRRRIYPELNPEPENKIIDKIRMAIIATDKHIDTEAIILLSIAKSTNLMSSILTRSEQKEYKARIKHLINGEITGPATKEAVEAMQAAVIIASIMPAIIASTTTST